MYLSVDRYLSWYHNFPTGNSAEVNMDVQISLWYIALDSPGYLSRVEYLGHTLVLFLYYRVS